MIAPFSSRFADGIRDLIVPIQQAEFGIPITYADQPDLVDIAGFYQKGAGQFWVALEDDHVVGTIALLDIGAGEGALRKMFVASAYRGAQHGTAATLLATLLGHARKNGLHTLYLGTTDKFLAAHRFYEKHGFDLIDPEGLPAAFPRMTVDSRFYQIRLESAW